MSYVSDSPAKSLTRARMWMRLISSIEVFKGRKPEGAFALAGHGGDLSTVKPLFPVKKMTAVDVDEDCVWWCSELYPSASVKHGSASEVCKDASTRPYDMAHLDFCSGLSVDNIKTVYDVIMSPRQQSDVFMLAVTMQKGREHKNKPNPVKSKLPRAERRRIQKLLGSDPGEQMYQKSFTPALAIERSMQLCRDSFDKSNRHMWKRTGKPTPLAHAVTRSTALWCCLRELLARHGRWITCQNVFSYHSKSKNSGGSPMFTAIYAIYPAGRLDIYNFVSSKTYYENLTAKDAKEKFRPTVLSWAKKIGVTGASDLFDVHPGTVRAWLAHDSRGTYVDEAAPLFYPA